MNQDFLQQFRQQLANWTKQYLAKQRLPFQRLELCPGVLTEKGRLVPDIVLWINRDSQLAGSMILLPTALNKDVLDEAFAMARALGLGHFVTWEARQVCIWQMGKKDAEAIQKFPLPTANTIQPEDFRSALEQLLNELKVIAVTTAPATTNFSLFYFANLCLRTLQEMGPGITESTRLAAGHTAADSWVELAPAAKTWMSVWRILFLLWQKRLPPGLQPDRMEQVFHYAMADFNGDKNILKWLELYPEEPPLTDQDAVRLHHLASRMSQLGWPQTTEQAATLVKQLLREVAHRYNLSAQQVSWQSDKRLYGSTMRRKAERITLPWSHRVPTLPAWHWQRSCLAKQTLPCKRIYNLFPQLSQYPMPLQFYQANTSRPVKSVMRSW
jgi:hypothetical protein